MHIVYILWKYQKCDRLTIMPALASSSTTNEINTTWNSTKHKISQFKWGNNKSLVDAITIFVCNFSVFHFILFVRRVCLGEKLLKWRMNNRQCHLDVDKLWFLVVFKMPKNLAQHTYTFIKNVVLKNRCTCFVYIFFLGSVFFLVWSWWKMVCLAKDTITIVYTFFSHLSFSVGCNFNFRRPHFMASVSFITTTIKRALQNTSWIRLLLLFFLPCCCYLKVAHTPKCFYL